MTDTALIPSSPLIAIENLINADPRLNSNHSRRQYRSTLVAFEAWRDGRPLTKMVVETYAAELQKLERSPSTINQKLAIIRWWARKVIDLAEEHIADDQTVARISKQAARVTTIEGVRGERPPRGRYLSKDEQAALIGACQSDPTPAGTRDAAMIAVALSCGFRRDDLTTLQIENIREDTGEDCTLFVHGKGDRIDKLYLYNGGYRALKTWLALRGDTPGAVFCPIKKRRINLKGRLSGEALRLILDHRQAGLNLAEHITWHDLRKTFICTLLDNGIDLSTTQKAARHQSPSTTANIYDIRGEQRKRDAVRTMEIPI